MGNKASNQSRRPAHQQPLPSTQGAAGSNQQIHQPSSNQPPGSLTSDPSHLPQPALTVERHRADDRAGQPFNELQAGTEQHQLIPHWLSEPRPLVRSDPALPRLTRRTPRRRENDYVPLPTQRRPVIEEQRQTVPLQLSVPPALPIARRSSFSQRSAEPFGEAAIRPGQAVPSEASAPRRTTVDTVDTLLASSAVEGAALPPPLLPLQAATPPLPPSRHRKPPSRHRKPPSRHRKPPAELRPHRSDERPLLGGDTCDDGVPGHVSRRDEPAASSPRPPKGPPVIGAAASTSYGLQRSPGVLNVPNLIRKSPAKGTPVIGAAASTSYGLQRSPGVLDVPNLIRKSPAAASGEFAAVRKCLKDHHRGLPESEGAQSTSHASIAATRASMCDASSTVTDRCGPHSEFHGARDGGVLRRRQDTVDDDERRAHVALRERRRPPPPPLSGEALESYVWDKLCPVRAPSAKSGQSQPPSIAPGFKGDGEACTSRSSRFIAGSSMAARTASFNDPAATPGELSADREGSRADRRGRRRPAREDVQHDSPASSAVPITSLHDASTTGADVHKPHRKSREAHDGREKRRVKFKVSDQELLSRVALRQQRWRPPQQLSSKAVESYLWAKLRPSKSRSADRGHSQPAPLLSPRDAHASASSRRSPRAGTRRAAFTDFGGLAEGYSADTEDDDERRRERSRYEQECYDAELSQRFAAAATVTAAPRASFGLLLDSAHVHVSAPITSSAAGAWAPAEVSQRPTMSEAATTYASSRSVPPQAPSLVVGSETAGRSSAAGLPLCGRLQPQAQVYSSQPMVPK